MKEFKKTFVYLVGLEWEERLKKDRMGKVRPESVGLETEECFFRFILPREGEPKGIFPPGARPF